MVTPPGDLIRNVTGPWLVVVAANAKEEQQGHGRQEYEHHTDSPPVHSSPPPLRTRFNVSRKWSTVNDSLWLIDRSVNNEML